MDGIEEENLGMENELLRLKLLAEFGGDSHSMGNLDPQLENDFLKQVMAFEQNYAIAKRVKIFDLLGQPAFKKADELDDEQVNAELEKATALLAERNIDINFSGTYDSRTKYSFIIDELFEHEADDFTLEGMATCFDYEEFHPNHELDIENRTKEFLNGWFEKDLDKRNWCFDETFILPDRTTLNKKLVTDKIKTVFDFYGPFTDCDYKILDIGFQLTDEGGMGHAEGLVKYKSNLENNEPIDIRGPFKLYLSSTTYGWWSIFHIVFPGFEY
ncbi:MAG TPA: hypothetical protein VG367_00875 [Mucilaginibacter sp.]|jgi:hypothetical protein|nr:hypothetical protein [Mucilaginibacter sp.]